MKLFRLDGQIAFVTGAGSGIGQSIAVGLAEAGADVACFDLAASKTMADTLRKVKEAGRKALALSGDVANEADMTAAVAKAEAELGPISVAVNSAGIANTAPAEELPLSQWQRLIDVNLTGCFLSCKAEGRAMLKRKQGSIINIASMSGTIANRGLLECHYNTSKAGVVHLSKSLAMEWADKGIRVNAISPGYTLTPMNLRAEVADQIAKFALDTPMQRAATPDEMVGPAIFLASKAASFVTGLDLIVDGGFVCW